MQSSKCSWGKVHYRDCDEWNGARKIKRKGDGVTCFDCCLDVYFIAHAMACYSCLTAGALCFGYIGRGIRVKMAI